MFLVYLLIFLPQILFAQSDRIILPDLDLKIEDHSRLNTGTNESASLRERNPEFHEVHLDEIRGGLEDASLSKALSQKNTAKNSQIGASYGSYNSVGLNASTKNTVSNVFYMFAYEGSFRQNQYYDGAEYLNTAMYKNHINAYADVHLTNDIMMCFNLQYKQRKQNYIGNADYNDFMQYIPMSFGLKKWFDERSYLDFNFLNDYAFIEKQNTAGIDTTNALFTDLCFNISYNSNPIDRIYFSFELENSLSTYSTGVANTALFTALSSYLLVRGLVLDLGFTLLSSTEIYIYGWPEAALKYNYADLLLLEAKVSGEVDMFNGEKAAAELQFFSLSPAIQYKWIYSVSAKATPVPDFAVGAGFSYNDYVFKRLYCYDSATQTYGFTSDDYVGLWNVNISAEYKIEDIFDITISYHYQSIPSDWLLYMPHKLNVTANAGYKPAGFNFQVSYYLYAPRLLEADNRTGFSNLLNLKITQKIFEYAELFIAADNILNQFIQFTEGTMYGGWQMSGGAVFYF